MKSRPRHPDWLLCGLLSLFLHAGNVPAGGFAATVSPPRFELKAAAGASVQEVVDIYNADTDPATFAIRTADWSLAEDGNVIIQPRTLQPGSCRPWMRIERHDIRLPGQGSRRFRFQVNVPKDAATTECRVALLVEGTGDDSVMAGNEGIRFPVRGRIAIIIYVNVGGAAPALQVLGFSLQEKQGSQIPFVQIRNTGNAHGRLSGILEGIDALGKHFDFTVSPSPIMPGQQRRIPLWPDSNRADSQPREIIAPLQLKGTIELEGGKYEVDTSVSPSHRIALTGN